MFSMLANAKPIAAAKKAIEDGTEPVKVTPVVPAEIVDSPQPVVEPETKPEIEGEKQQESQFSPPKERSVIEEIRECMSAAPSTAKEILSKELGKFDRTVLSLQIEQQTILEKKSVAEAELSNRRLENESLSKLLADQIKDEKYSEAELLQQRLNALSANIKKQTEDLAKLRDSLDANEQRKLSISGEKAKLLSEFNALYQGWIVSHSAGANQNDRTKRRKSWRSTSRSRRRGSTRGRSSWRPIGKTWPDSAARSPSPSPNSHAKARNWTTRLPRCARSGSRSATSSTAR